MNLADDAKPPEPDLAAAEWPPADRGALLGYRLYWGRSLVHIMKITTAGPGAVDRHAICGDRVGSALVLLVSSYSGAWCPPPAEWRQEREGYATYKTPGDVPLRPDLCPRCRAARIRLGRAA